METTILDPDDPSDDPVPAIPPNDYSGTIAEWMVELQTRGHLPPDADIGDHVDVMIPEEEWWDILEACES